MNHPSSRAPLAYAQLVYPVAGEIITEGLDLSTPELRECEEVLREMMEYNHPPQDVCDRFQSAMEAVHERLSQHVRMRVGQWN